jgi:hypothetical protein
MTHTLDRETTGAWVIHHGQKIALNANAEADFPVIDEAAKASTLLVRLGQSQNDELSNKEVRAVATAAGINPRYQLDALLRVLAEKRLVEVSDNGVAVLGITSRGALGHASDIFDEAEPSPFEQASITLAEKASIAPVRKSELIEEIGDRHELTRSDVLDFFTQAEEIGFVDHEGDEGDRLFFNGNLFRRDSVDKSRRVLQSLSQPEAVLLLAFQERLKKAGCLTYENAESELGQSLLEKLVAAGVFDLNRVQNELGTHVFVTAPAAFHKFVNPLVDDCFDLAKALVAALTFGMKARSARDGRIEMIGALLRKLIRGDEVGPAPAIGQDYHVLEVQRVIKTRRAGSFTPRYFMKLLKREVGELALSVLSGSANTDVGLTDIPSASMSGYVGPERSRSGARKKQSELSKRTTRDLLESLRGGGF